MSGPAWARAAASLALIAVLSFALDPARATPADALAAAGRAAVTPSLHLTLLRVVR